MPLEMNLRACSPCPVCVSVCLFVAKKLKILYQKTYNLAIFSEP